MANTDYRIKLEQSKVSTKPFAEYFQTHTFPTVNRQGRAESLKQGSSNPFIFNETLTQPAPEKLQVDSPQRMNDLPVSDMDLSNLLEMDDKALTELAGGGVTDWNSLFNGQLDFTDTSVPDPMTGIQGFDTNNVQNGVGLDAPTNTMQFGSGNGSTALGNGLDGCWLFEETHKLERQQKIQQQKLFELQQTLLKTEILKNQLQIASISQGQVTAVSPTSAVTASVLNGLGSPLLHGSNHVSSNLPVQSTVQPPVSLSNTKSSKVGVASARQVAVTVTKSKQATNVKPVKPKLALSPSTSMNDPTTLCTFIDGDELDSDALEPDKRKVHNLIEKKYRCSINDRIALLRDMVSKHGKDNKRLQKSAVLQKTIEYIHHLEVSVRRLTEENEKLKEALASGKSRMPSYTSPPATPHVVSTVSPRSGTESEGDSGNPSSPDDFLSDASRDTSPSGPLGSAVTNKRSYLASHLIQSRPSHESTSKFSRYLMMFTLLTIFFIDPFTLFSNGRGFSSLPHPSGSTRVLNAIDVDTTNTTSFYYIGFWILRLLAALLCFGWMTLTSLPKISSNSNDTVHFWRFKRQAEDDLLKGNFVGARDNLEVALAVLNHPLPTSYYGIFMGLLWSLLSHVMFQVAVGKWAIGLAWFCLSDSHSKPNHQKTCGSKLMFSEVSRTYHLLHQLYMSTGVSHLHAMEFYLGINAANFAEADTHPHGLSQQEIAEIYFMLCLQSHFSLPSCLSYLAMWYYYLCFRNTYPKIYATLLNWSITKPGQNFLFSTLWSSEVEYGSKLYSGKASLPFHSLTRAYCKQQLCQVFSALLLTDSPHDDQYATVNEALYTFKKILKIAKEANNVTQCGFSVATGSSDLGFSVIQWWASVGIVACYWIIGSDTSAEDYYSCIEAQCIDSTAVPSTLQLAFKANVMYKMHKASLSIIQQLCTATSKSLMSCVADLLPENFSSSEAKLNELGVFLACDWLLSLQMTLWENYGKEKHFAQEICLEFYNNVETLSRVVNILPSAITRLRLYRGYHQLIAGTNPIYGTGSFSIKRSTSKNNPSICTHDLG